MLDIRYLPRIEANIPVRVLDQQGNIFDARISNISPGGVMIVVDEAQKDDITGNTDALSARVVELEIECDLPGEPKAFEAECRLVFMRRLSQHEFHLGFRFFNLNQDMSKLLNSYVNKHSDRIGSPATRHNSTNITHQNQHHEQALRKQQA